MQVLIYLKTSYPPAIKTISSLKECSPAIVLVGLVPIESLYHFIQNKQIEIYVCDSLEDTVKMAHKVAKQGQIVLFSPASARYYNLQN